MNKKILIGLVIIVLIGAIFMVFSKKPSPQPILTNQPGQPGGVTQNEVNQNKTEEENQICVEGLSWGFRGVEYKMTGWENHELAGKNRKLCCGISKDYEGTIYKACVYDEDYILWIKSPQTNGEFRKETVGYKKGDQFCKISYNYYEPGEKIISEDCYTE